MDRRGKRITRNGVKESLRKNSSFSPGRESHERQVTPDRKPATVRKSKLTHMKEKEKRERLKIGTWNVRTMYQTGKLNNVIKEMQRMKVNIFGVSETRWTGKGKFTTEGMTIIYSGAEKHQAGVAFIMDKETTKSLLGHWEISERVIAIKIQAKPFNINIIQVYAPTTDHEEEDVDKFYDEIEKAKGICKSQEVLIVMGDLNAKVGKERRGIAVGPHGLGEMNLQLLQPIKQSLIWFQNRRAKWRRQENFTSQIQTQLLDQTSVTSTSLVSETKYSAVHHQDLETVSAAPRLSWAPNDNVNISYHNNLSWPNAASPFAPLPYLSPFLEFPCREPLMTYEHQTKQAISGGHGYTNFLQGNGGSPSMARFFETPTKEFMSPSQGFLPPARHVGLPLNCSP